MCTHIFKREINYFIYRLLKKYGPEKLVHKKKYPDRYMLLFPEIKCLKPNCLGGRDGKVSVFPCYFQIFPDQFTRKKLEQVNIVI